MKERIGLTKRIVSSALMVLLTLGLDLRTYGETSSISFEGGEDDVEGSMSPEIVQASESEEIADSGSVCDGSCGEESTTGLRRHRYYFKTYTLPHCQFRRVGYEFAGWMVHNRCSNWDYWYTDWQTYVYANGRYYYGPYPEGYRYRVWAGCGILLRASWRRIQSYTIRFHRNNSSGDGATASRACTTGKSRKLPTIQELGWTRRGYEFAGWATSATSHFTVYADGQSVKDLSKSQGAVVHLYAVWY